MKKTHFVLILSCMLLFGCKGEQSQDNSSEKQEREYQYGIDDMKKSYLKDSLPGFLSCIGDDYFFLKAGETDDLNDLWRYNINLDVYEQVYSLEEAETIFLITSDGVNIAFLSKCWYDDGSSKSFITRSSEDGFERCDISDVINHNMMFLNADMIMDNNGDIWFYSDTQQLFCLKKDGSITSYNQEGNIEGIILDDSKNASVLVFYNNELRLINPVSGNSKSVQLQEYPDAQLSGVAHGFLQDNLVFWTGDTGYFVNFDKRNINPFITAEDLYITNLSNCYFDVCDGRLFLYEDSFSGEQIKVNRSTLAQKTEGEKTKTQLVLGAFGSDNYLIDSVREFNLSHSEYEITVKNYFNWSSDDGGLSDFTKDLIDGNVPDIMLMNEKMHPYQLVDKGIFCDMREFLDKETGIFEEDFMTNILAACTYHDCLYALPGEFVIKGCLARTEFVGGESNLSLDETEKILTKNEGLNMTYYSEPYLLLRGLLIGGEREFVDDNGLTCQKEDLEKLLLFAQKYGKANLSDNFSLFDYFCQGKLLFIFGKEISPYELKGDISEIKAETDNTVIITGIPGIKGDSLYADILSEYAISSFCQNKDIAWEFVRQFYEEDYQDVLIYNGIFSALKGVNERFIESLQVEEAYKEQYRELLSHRIYVYDPESEISDIIAAEAQMYFNGDRTLSETVDILYSRLNIFAQERR